MGRGFAKEAADRYPGIDKLAGMIIKEISLYDGMYGVTFLPGNLGLFQVKDHWRDAADLEIIENSAAMLTYYAKTVPWMTFHLNYPGIGNGRLTEEKVYPFIRNLPDNVIVWKKEIEDVTAS